MANKYCMHCGTQLPPLAKFCPSCGTPFGATKTESSAASRSRRRIPNNGDGEDFFEDGTDVFDIPEIDKLEIDFGTEGLEFGSSASFTFNQNGIAPTRFSSKNARR